MPKNAEKYPLNGVTLASVKAKIVAACKKFGIDVDTKGADMADTPEDNEDFMVRAKDVEDLADQIKSAKTQEQKDACIALAKKLNCTKMIPDSWREEDKTDEEERSDADRMDAFRKAQFAAASRGV
jgi:hypothetical protein